MPPFILGLIPARGGSKGIPGKNLQPVAGKPLLVYSIEAAQQSKTLSDFIVSTDSEQIASVARAAGAPVPFLRPAEFATDDAPSIHVVRHAVLAYEALHAVRVDVTVLLQPTSPLRTSEDIDEAVRMLLRNPHADSLVSCCEGSFAHPGRVYAVTGSDLLEPVGPFHTLTRRQDLPNLLWRNGALYLSRRALVMEAGLLRDDRPLGYVMPRSRSIDVDTPFDLHLVRLLLSHHAMPETPPTPSPATHSPSSY